MKFAVIDCDTNLWIFESDDKSESLAALRRYAREQEPECVVLVEVLASAGFSPEEESESVRDLLPDHKTFIDGLFGISEPNAKDDRPR